MDSNGDHPPSDPSSATRPVSSLPSTGARLLAFSGIFIAGICGGLIGYAFVDLQCEGDCTVQAGIGGLIGALIFGVGTGVVAVLALRAMNEWDTIKERKGDTPQ